MSQGGLCCAAPRVGQSGSAGGCGCPCVPLSLCLSIPEPVYFVPVPSPLSSDRVNPGMAAPSGFTDPVPS